MDEESISGRTPYTPEILLEIYRACDKLASEQMDYCPLINFDEDGNFIEYRLQQFNVLFERYFQQAQDAYYQHFVGGLDVSILIDAIGFFKYIYSLPFEYEEYDTNGHFYFSIEAFMHVSIYQKKTKIPDPEFIKNLKSKFANDKNDPCS